MKKIKNSKLSLNAETLRTLTEPQMKGAAGGWPSAACTLTRDCQTYQGCSFTLDYNGSCAASVTKCTSNYC